MSRRDLSSPDQPALIPVETEVPLPTPNDLTQAWCVGYGKTRSGRAPHPNVVKRVGRVAKNIGADCATIDDWRQAWRAAFAAGQQGRWDITAVLIDEHPPNLHAAPTAAEALAQRMQRTSIPGDTVDLLPVMDRRRSL